MFVVSFFTFKASTISMKYTWICDMWCKTMHQSKCMFTCKLFTRAWSQGVCECRMQWGWCTMDSFSIPFLTRTLLNLPIWNSISSYDIRLFATKKDNIKNTWCRLIYHKIAINFNNICIITTRGCVERVLIIMLFSHIINCQGHQFKGFAHVKCNIMFWVRNHPHCACLWNIVESPWCVEVLMTWR